MQMKDNQRLTSFHSYLKKINCRPDTFVCLIHTHTIKKIEIFCKFMIQMLPYIMTQSVKLQYCYRISRLNSTVSDIYRHQLMQESDSKTCREKRRVLMMPRRQMIPNQIKTHPSIVNICNGVVFHTITLRRSTMHGG